MNIDERLDKLTERHEALTQTVELLAADMRDVVAAQKENERILGQLMQGIARLLFIAEVHDKRLDGHDGRLEKLEGGES